MTCPKCNAEIGEEKKCPACGYEEAEVQENKQTTTPVAEAPAEQVAPVADNAAPVAVAPVAEGYDAPPAPQKKKSKAGLIAAIIVVVVLALAAAAFFVFKGFKKDDGFVQRSLYFKENAIYYLDPKTNESILITDNFFDDDDAEIANVLIMNSIEFKQKGNKVFYSEKIDLETNSFSLYYKQLNKPDEEPVKLAEDVTTYAVNEKGTLLVYLNTDGDLYKHDMTERSKIISEAEELWVSEDCTKILYHVEDGGLYIQDIEGEKDKIDSDVTSVANVSDNLDSFCYFKEEDLYLKKADTDKIKIDTEVENVILYGDNGGIYYTKANEQEGTGTLLDFVKYSDSLQKKDEDLIDEYSNSKNYKKRNEALFRSWTKEVLEKTEIESTSSLYYFNGETSNLLNDSFVDYESAQSEADAVVIRSFDNVKIKETTISDFVDVMDSKYKYRKSVENNKTVYKSDYQAAKYFKEYSDKVLKQFETDATYYFIKDGKAIEINTDDISSTFRINKSGNTVYYIDKLDKEKNVGELREVKIKDGAIESNTLYDSDVSGSILNCFSDTDLLYTKDNNDSKFDLYLNKELIEYDVSHYSLANQGKEILYYTEYDDEKDIGTLSIYTNGEKKKIADEVYTANVLENGDVLYLINYSKKNNKGDLYIYTDEKSTRIDYDVSKVFITTNIYKYNFILSYATLWDDLEIDW